MPKMVSASSVRPEPTRPAMPRISPPAQHQRDVVHLVLVGDVAQLQHGVADRHRHLGEQLVDRAADHHRDERGIVDLWRSAWCRSGRRRAAP